MKNIVRPVRSRRMAATPSRREALQLIGAVGVSAIVGCSSSSSGSGAGGGGGSTTGGGVDAGTDAAANADDAGADLATAGSDAAQASECVLTAEQEEGPFYIAVDAIRSDITDGKAGVPLALTFTIIDVTTCQPLANAALDIWHCDYTGIYSDEASQSTTGQTFHRGVQITNAAGQASFASVFPGWYDGRTIHVHIKVHIGGAASGSTYSGGHVSHTGNVFFPQALNDAVAAVSPYDTGDTNARTLNANDNVWSNQNGSKYVCTVAGSASSAITASIVLGVDPTATPVLIGVHS